MPGGIWHDTYNCEVFQSPVLSWPALGAAQEENLTICGPGYPELSKSYMDMASKLFTFTFTLHLHM